MTLQYNDSELTRNVHMDNARALMFNCARNGYKLTAPDKNTLVLTPSDADGWTYTLSMDNPRYQQGILLNEFVYAIDSDPNN